MTFDWMRFWRSLLEARGYTWLEGHYDPAFGYTITYACPDGGGGEFAAQTTVGVRQMIEKLPVLENNLADLPLPSSPEGG